MTFKFLPLGLWRFMLLLSSLGLLGLAALLFWLGNSAGWEGFGTGEILLTVIALGGGLILLYLLASLREMFVVVEPGQIRIKAGFLLDATIPLKNIRSAEPSDHSFFDGIGVRMNLSGTLSVVTSAKNIVQLNLKEPQRMGFVTVRLSKAQRIKLSLEDPQAFLKTVREQVGEEKKDNDQPGAAKRARRAK